MFKHILDSLSSLTNAEEHSFGDVVHDPDVRYYVPFTVELRVSTCEHCHIEYHLLVEDGTVDAFIVDRSPLPNFFPCPNYESDSDD